MNDITNKNLAEMGLHDIKDEFRSFALSNYAIFYIEFSEKCGEPFIKKMNQYKNHAYPITLPKLQLVFTTYLQCSVLWKEKYNKLLDKSGAKDE